MTPRAMHTITFDVYFAGDSITRRWGATDYPDVLAHWRQTFFGWNAANFGWGGDTTQNILWRLVNGELDDVNPKVIVLQAGANNPARVTAADDRAATAEDVARGIRATLDVMRAKAPASMIIVTAIFPRSDHTRLGVHGPVLNVWTIVCRYVRPGSRIT